eukprot:8624-Heterococcus_DN1.PRE.3
MSTDCSSSMADEVSLADDGLRKKSATAAGDGGELPEHRFKKTLRWMPRLRYAIFICNLPELCAAPRTSCDAYALNAILRASVYYYLLCTVEGEFNSNAFEALERDFQDVLSELVGDKSLERFRLEYEKLHRALKKSHDQEKRLIKKCRELNGEIVNNAAKVQTALKLSQEDQATISSLRKEIEKAWTMVDVAHEKECCTDCGTVLLRLKEQLDGQVTRTTDMSVCICVMQVRAKETINQLKDEISNLSKLVEKGAGLSMGQETMVKELVKAERATQEAKLQEARDTISTKDAEINREQRRRERLDKELRDLRTRLDTRTAAFEEMGVEVTKQQTAAAAAKKQLAEYKSSAAAAIATGHLEDSSYDLYASDVGRVHTTDVNFMYSSPVLNQHHEMPTTLASTNTIPAPNTARGTMEKYLHDYDALFGRTQKLTEDLEEQMRRNALLVTESGKACVQAGYKSCSITASDTNHKRLQQHCVSLCMCEQERASKLQNDETVKLQTELSLWERKLERERKQTEKFKALYDESKTPLAQAQAAIQSLHQELDVFRHREDKFRKDVERRCDTALHSTCQQSHAVAAVTAVNGLCACVSGHCVVQQRPMLSADLQARCLLCMFKLQAAERDKSLQQLATKKAETALTHVLRTTTDTSCALLACYCCDVMLTQQQDKTRATEDDVKEQERIANSLEAELNSYKTEVSRRRKDVFRLEREREKFGTELSEARGMYMQALEDVKLREMRINELGKRVSEWEAKLKQQQQLYESVRSDRNLYSKTLIEAQDEIAEMKRKFKIMNHQIEQLKEEITSKDHALVKEHFDHQRADKQRDQMRNEIDRMRKLLESNDDVIHKQDAEVRRLAGMIRRMDDEALRQRKEYDQVINERDILGTQLIRRNDELALLYEKLKIQQSTLRKGEAGYAQRLLDCRTLRLKAQDLARDLALCKNSSNQVEDLRREALQNQRELLQEKTKVKALSEGAVITAARRLQLCTLVLHTVSGCTNEAITLDSSKQLENPMNVHRWRRLEGSDPATYEMEKQRLYHEIKAILARQPGPEVAEQLSAYQASAHKVIKYSHTLHAHHHTVRAHCCLVRAVTRHIYAGV